MAAEGAEEERLMVLRMLEAGKITAAEAAELLKALGHAGRPAPPHWPPGEAWEMHRGGFHRPRLGRGIKALVREVVDFLPFDVGPLVGPFEGRSYRFQEAVEGAFAPGAGTIRLDVKGGRALVLRAWDQPGFKVLLNRRAFGEDEEDARRNAAELGGVRYGKDFLEIDAGRSLWGRMAVEAWLPASFTYDAQVRSRNGRVEVEGLSFGRLEAGTHNGRVRLDGCRACSADAFATNGSIWARVSAERFSAMAGNGSVMLEPGTDRSGEYRVRSHNGSIEVLLRPGPGVGYRVEAQTSLGRVRCEDLPDLEVERQRTGVVGDWLLCRTHGFDQQPVKVSVSAMSSRGRVRLGCAGAGPGPGSWQAGPQGEPPAQPPSGPSAGQGGAGPEAPPPEQPGAGGEA
ncbi:MAG: hypothetical protein K6T75_08450 [Acetobacteraceae bacterium]|nr:hypothetical protein [Acetobacteraceae bacterium]